MSRLKKDPPNPPEEQARKTVSMTQRFWEEEAEPLMKQEGYNNFSAYVQFLIKLRREVMHARRMEVEAMEDRKAGRKPSANALNETNPEDPPAGPKRMAS